MAVVFCPVSSPIGASTYQPIFASESTIMRRPLDGCVPHPNHTTQLSLIDCCVFVLMMLGFGGQRWPQSTGTIIDRFGDFLRPNRARG